MNTIKIIKFSEINKEKVLFDIKELWNHEVGFIFPFYRDLLIQKIYNCKYFSSDSSFLIYKSEKLLGFIISKVYDNDPIMSKYINTGWISLLYISTSYRKQGYGTELLRKAEEEFIKKGITKIMVGADYDNFFPGIPSEFIIEAKGMFTSNGYNILNTDYDMLLKVNKTMKKPVDNKGYVVRFADKKDKSLLLKFFEENFYGRWYYEALEYFNNYYEENTYLIAIDCDKIVGFLRINNHNSNKISYNVNWNKLFDCLYSFGPLGVDRNERKKGISRILLETGINYSIDQKASDILIDWTSLVELYNKFGFDIWKSYIHAEKKCN